MKSHELGGVGVGESVGIADVDEQRWPSGGHSEVQLPVVDRVFV